MIPTYPNVTATSINVATSTNTDTSTDMAANNFSILINASAFQFPQYPSVPQVNYYCFYSNVSVNSNAGNVMLPLFFSNASHLQGYNSRCRYFL